MSTSRASSIPHLAEWPLLGSTLAYLQNPLALFSLAAQQCGEIAQYHIGPLRVVQFNSPELVQSFLVEHAPDQHKGNPASNLFFPFIGNGLLISEGTLHQTQRQLLEPSFQTDQLTQYADTIVDFANRKQGAWTNENSPLDLMAEMSSLTMGIITKLMLNTEVSLEKDQLGQAYATALDWINHAILQPLHLPLNFPNTRNMRTKAALKQLKSAIGAIVQDHRKNQDQGDILSKLLAAQDANGVGMSDEQAYNEIITVFGAGQATVATSLVWTCYLLAQHPDVYNLVEQEIDSVLQGRLPTYADLANLPYLLQVYKEALRLYPATSLLVRSALYDTQFKGYPIKHGDMLIVSNYVLHRQAQYFPNPTKFDPERFNPTRERQLPPYAFIPFGAGPRSCLGKHFAPIEGHLILATLAQKVKFELVEPNQTAEPELAFSLRPKGGLQLRFKRRNSSQATS